MCLDHRRKLGIGAALARELAARGHVVAATARKRAR